MSNEDLGDMRTGRMKFKKGKIILLKSIDTLVA